ncbi:hypothetical protein V492_05741, partial [Pseudogymnoascus sp. VKM F-4246]
GGTTTGSSHTTTSSRTSPVTGTGISGGGDAAEVAREEQKQKQQRQGSYETSPEVEEREKRDRRRQGYGEGSGVGGGGRGGSASSKQQRNAAMLCYSFGERSDEGEGGALEDRNVDEEDTGLTLGGVSHKSEVRAASTLACFPSAQPPRAARAPYRICG